MMNNLRKLTADLMVVLLLVISWPATGKSQERRAQGRLRTAPGTASKANPPAGNPTAKFGNMSLEEKLVRDVYARLMRYQSAGVDELAAESGKSAEPGDYLTFEIRNIRTGPIADIYNSALTEVVTTHPGASIKISPVHLGERDGTAHAYYDAKWNSFVLTEQQPVKKETSQTWSPGAAPAEKKLRELEAPLLVDQNRTFSASKTQPEISAEPNASNKLAATPETVSQMLSTGGEHFAGVNRYAAYNVSVVMQGQRYNYRAMMVYRLDKTDASTITRPEQVQTLDNLVPGLTEVYGEESARLRAPWTKYVRSSLYLAVTRAIRENREAGKPLIPADAPIGYLPGDDVTVSLKGTNMLAADTVLASETSCVIPTVASLQATMISTKNAATGTRPTAGTFNTTNAATSFAGTSTSDLAVVFQGATTLAVAAQGVNPSTAANQLRWKIDRDSSETGASGLPALSVQAGPQVTVTPSVSGNFNITCWNDNDGDGAYNAGEELRVMHLAVVKASVNSNDSSIDSGVQFTGAADGVSTELAMAMNFSVTLEGGGANKLVGVNKIHLGNVGNLRADTSQINYPVPQGGAAATQQGDEPMLPIEPIDPPEPTPTPTPPPTPTPTPSGNVPGTAMENPGGQLPMIDAGNVAVNAEPTGGASVFRASSAEDGTGAARFIRSDDSPGFGPWAVNHPRTGNPWKTTLGGYDFREFIAGFSDTFPRYYVVLGRADWTIRAIGTRTGGVWTDSGGSAVTLQGTTNGSAAFTLTVTGGSPQPGDDAGIQILGLSYVNQKSYVYTP